MALVDTEHLVLSNSDFAAHALPIPLDRNFTVQGVWQHAVGRIPYFDFAYVKAKVQLGPYVFLTLEQLMVRRTRSDPSFRGPGFDLTTDDSGRDPRVNGSFGAVVFKRSINLAEICMPPAYVAPSLGGLPRPRELPGNQSMYAAAAVTDLHPNCTIPFTSFDLPFEQQCVQSTGGMYVDVALYCYSLNAYGNQVKTGYVSHILNSQYQCYQYMTVECTKQYGGVVGCYNYFSSQQQQVHISNGSSTTGSSTTASSTTGGGSSSSLAAAATVAPRLAGAGDGADGVPTVTGSESPASGDGGGGGGGSSTAVIVGSVVGGVVGGILLLAAGVAVTALLVGRRRRRRYAASAAADGKQAGDSESGSSSSGSSCCGVRPPGGGAASAVNAGGGHTAAVGKGDMASSQRCYGGNASDDCTSLQAATDHPDSLSPQAAPGGGGAATAAAAAEPTVNGRARSLRSAAAEGDAQQEVAVVLLSTVLGKGSFGKVVAGLYAGRRVAVKLIDLGLMQQLLQRQQGQQGQGQQAVPQLLQPVPQQPVPQQPVPPQQGQGQQAQPGQQQQGQPVPPQGQLPVPPQQAQAELQQDQAQQDQAQPQPQEKEKENEQARQSRQQQQQQQQQQAEAEAAALAAPPPPPHQLHQQTGMRRMRDAVIASMAQEVQVLARVQHPNIVTLLAANLNPPHVCLVMERMDTSLDRLLYKDPGRPFPLSLAVHIALQVARALEYLHPTIVHRDLKPGNVLISFGGGGGGGDASALPLREQAVVAKLADFGLSRLRATVLVTKNPEVGTGPYMAPECFDVSNNAITDRADCYSFGVLLWELIARSHPWAGLTMLQMAVRVVMGGVRLPMLPLARAGASPKLQRLVTQCFDADPQRRPAAAEIVKQLLLVQQHLGPGSRG
ncbi:hypothetical protein HXX76_010499 [Chlamydomonas incerta]|uniref:Protein kinase domain-containing protein n=1 Tax=Chlamydomonas incerta TaxID=51695 RepID=A0A835VWR1_CHLIN|nr:hypothetical protein HXX76_010499 [Chlamydomonas incerta]|eukprot:KAG2428354.1 hypothetical protein HXX76_010499 [Chlamydomonas incerta]